MTDGPVVTHDADGAIRKHELIEQAIARLQAARRAEGGSLRLEAFRVIDDMRSIIDGVDSGRIKS
jgi:hypothetical protein